MLDQFKRYVPFEKFDDEQRMVYGWASTPELDSQGDKISLAALKKALPDYLRWSNIREMHQNVAVGVAKEHELNTRGLYIGAKIVDANAWLKVKEGVYKGFSIGGRELGREGETVTDLTLTEISLVDRPANESCKIEVWKAAGSEAAEEEDVDKDEDSLKPYGDVKYADPGYQADGKKRYPIDTEAHCRAAWSYINMPRNASKYSAKQVSQIKSRIRSAGSKFGIKFSDKIDALIDLIKTEGIEAIKKNMYGVSEMASVFDRLTNLLRLAEQEAEWEQDAESEGHETLSELHDLLSTAARTLETWVAEEIREFKAGTDMPPIGALAMSVTRQDLEKRYGKDHMAHLDGLHKACKTMGDHIEAAMKSHKRMGPLHDGASSAHGQAMDHLKGLGIGGEKAAEGGDDEETEKAEENAAEVTPKSPGEMQSAGPKAASAEGLMKIDLDDLEERLTKAVGKQLAKSQQSLLEKLEEMDERLARVEGQPAPSPKGHVRVVAEELERVEKGADAKNGNAQPQAAQELEKLDPRDPDYPLKLLRRTHQTAPKFTGLTGGENLLRG